jgi:3-oxoacyl-(acyl-carrier-protein) synthase
MTTVSPLTVLSEYRWPPGHPAELPALPGYVLSSFSPLVAAAAEGCLAGAALSAAARERIAVLLVSAGNDVVSAAHVRDRVAAGRRVGPLLFFQAAPNSIVGQVSGQWGLGGPVVCISPVSDAFAEAMAEAKLLLDDGDADAVLLILIEQAAVEQAAVEQATVEQAAVEQAGTATAAFPGTGDRAHAVLLSAQTSESLS